MADSPVRLATSTDASSFAPIERAAGELFRGTAAAHLADGVCISDEAARSAASDGRALVAVDSAKRPLGFLTWSRRDDVFEIEQVSVLPEAGRAGRGTALVHRALTTAARLGCSEIVLNTQAHVPWNAPWYRRFGFESIGRPDWSDRMRSTVRTQEAAGIPWEFRCWMRLDIDVLQGGVANAGAVARAGNLVMRPANEHSDVLHRFLRHLRQRGFEGASEPVSIDDGVELLRFIEGDVPVPPYPSWAQTDTAIMSSARLIRDLHDASTGFDTGGARWSNEMNDRAPGAEPVICHNDVCLENIVFREGKAVGLLDFDFAAPGRPAFDLTSFARMCVPVDDDVNAPTLGWETADRPRRVRLVADAYGLDATGRAEMLTCLDESVARGGEFVLRHVEAGEQGFIEMWERMGGMARFDRRREWWATARADFADSLA